MSKNIKKVLLLDQHVDRKEFILRAGNLSDIYKSLSELHQLKIKDWLINTLKEDCAEDVLTALEEGLKEAENMSIGFLRYEEEQKEIARREGKLEGILEGELKNKIEVAKQMLLLDMDIETIMQITKLDRETIKSLKS